MTSSLTEFWCSWSLINYVPLSGLIGILPLLSPRQCKCVKEISGHSKMNYTLDLEPNNSTKQDDLLHNSEQMNVTCCPCKNATMSSQNGQTDFDAFLYIIVVLSFYATSMVLLMIKYIRREEEEISLDHYYTEFVEREHFHDIRNRNKMLVQLIAKDQRVEKMIQNGQDIKGYVYDRKDKDFSLQVLTDSTKQSLEIVPDGSVVPTIPLSDEEADPGPTPEVRLMLETDL